MKVKKDLNYFAKANIKGSQKVFGIKDEDRFQHMYIVGQSGTGKSVLLYNLAIQDIVKNKSVCVIDPHGDLIEQILKEYPEHRKKDLIHIDIYKNQNFKFNPLYPQEELPLQLSSLMSVFTRIWSDAWSSRMEYILSNALHTLLVTGTHKFEDIHKLLVGNSLFRQVLISKLQDKFLLNFWKDEFESWSDSYRQEAVAPILNKLGQFLSSPVLRKLFDSKEKGIDIEELMSQNKVLLINLSKGKLGEDNAKLLGSLLLNQIYISTMKRSKQEISKRKEFFVFIDEFQDFANKSFGELLAEARKFKVSLTIANQFLDQLKDKSDDFVKNAVFGNVATIISFRVGARDAKFLSEEFGEEVDARDLTSLDNYKIILRLLIDKSLSKAFLAQTLPPLTIKDLEYDELKIQKARFKPTELKLKLPGAYKIKKY